MRCAAGPAIALVLAAPAQAAPPARIIADIDLAPFHARAAGHLIIRQASPVPDPQGMQETVPGPIALCLERAGGCDKALGSSVTGDDGPFSEPHDLGLAKIVRPCGPARPPLLVLRTLSLPGGNGDQAVLTQALAYDRKADRFVRAFARQVGHNNNQEVRLIERGPLAGAFVTAVPTRTAPFAYWVTVETPDAAYRYRQAVRLRSRVRYGDGDPRAVIDAEMPAILRAMAGRRVCAAPSTNR